jgi:hypothetical protein
MMWIWRTKRRKKGGKKEGQDERTKKKKKARTKKIKERTKKKKKKEVAEERLNKARETEKQKERKKRGKKHSIISGLNLDLFRIFDLSNLVILLLRIPLSFSIPLKSKESGGGIVGNGPYHWKDKDLKNKKRPFPLKLISLWF